MRRLAEHGGDVVDVADEMPSLAGIRGAEVVVDLNVSGTDVVAADRGGRRYARRSGCWARWPKTGGGSDGSAAAATWLWSPWAADSAAIHGWCGSRCRDLVGPCEDPPSGALACSVRVVDVDDPSQVADAVLAELCGGRFVEVGWTGGRRHVLLPGPAPVANPVAAPGCPPDPPAAVVLTGGGRGIGYQLARHLRAEWGCRVIVSGRLDLADFPAEELTADVTSFRALRDERLRGCRGGEQLRAVRAEIARLVRARELRRNLDAASRAGQDLEYRCCDVTDAAAVARLLDGVDGPIAAVVHDAGIDRPARVGRKPLEDAEAVVAVKVDGFLNVLAALGQRPAGVVCAVGSLTGRFGGTAGQTDYAGANEALARLAEWAGERVPGTVTCLSWPTWESAGLITNAAAAVREMSALSIESGVAAWNQELRAPYPGEVLHLGKVAALAPVQLRSLPVPSDYAGSAALIARRHLLGDVESWAPSVQFATRHRVRAARLPAASGFRVRGRPGLPVSVLAEMMLDGANWLRPQPPAAVRVVALRSMRVAVGPLALPPAGCLTVRRLACSRWSGDSWLVDVALEADAGNGSVPVAAATVVCRAEGRKESGRNQPFCELPSGLPGGLPGELPTGLPMELPTELPTGAGEVSWCAAAGVMSASAPGRWRTVWAEPRRGTDLWMAVHPPEPVLPVGVLEAVLWVTCSATATADSSLHVDEIPDRCRGRCLQPARRRGHADRRRCPAQR